MMTPEQSNRLQVLESELDQSIEVVRSELVAMLKIIRGGLRIVNAMEEPLDRHGIEKCRKDLVDLTTEEAAANLIDTLIGEGQ